MKTKKILPGIGVLVIFLMFVLSAPIVSAGELVPAGNKLEPQVTCPTNCECMTEADAKEKFTASYEKCSDKVCGYSGGEPTTTPGTTTKKIPKYCFKGAILGARVVTECPSGCECLTEEEANKEFDGNYVNCLSKSTQCIVDGKSDGLVRRCFTQPSVTTTKDDYCPSAGSGCECMTEKEANKEFNGNYVKCSDAPCLDYHPDYGNPPDKYCFKEKSKIKIINKTLVPTTIKPYAMEMNCPNDCKCLTEMAAERQGLYYCNNEVTICGYETTPDLTAAAPNAIGVPKYCFTDKPIYAKCQDNCECMNRKDAYEKGYELCNGVMRECAAGLYCFQKPTVEICGKDTLIVTRRINPKSVSPPAYVNVYLSVKPVKTLNGIIITEKIPNGVEPAWDYARVSFDADVEQKINESSFAREVVKTIEAKWTSRKPDSWDPDTREAKWVLRDEDGIKPQTFMYKLKVVSVPADAFKFNGNWLISSGETCPIIGDEIVEIKPSEGWPPCPISDLELLKYNDMWANGELTDMQMLQAIYVWAKKPDCGPTIQPAIVLSEERIAILRETSEKLNLLADEPMPENLTPSQQKEFKDYSEWLRNSSKQIASLATRWERHLGDVEEEDAQLASIDLQNMLQKQQQTMAMMSQISKHQHDTAMAVIRKMG